MLFGLFRSRSPNDPRDLRDAWPLLVEVIPADRDPLASPQTSRLVAGFLLLGLAARVIRYLLRFPLWEDECFLSANLLHRDYQGLLAGLKYDQVCPFGFLWIQLTIVKLLGFHEYSLRLWSIVTGLVGILLFHHVAKQFLRGTPLVLAVAIFCVAYPGIRYAAEAKPYGTDLFVSLLLTTLALEWWRWPRRRLWVWGLAVLIPVAVAVSYPSVFVGGAISLLVAWVLWKRGDGYGWLAWAAYNAAMVASFAAVMAISAAQENRSTVAFMQSYWQEGFPPLAQPLRLLVWLVATHASDLLAYPFGGQYGGSTLTLICCVVGVGALVRRRHYVPLAFWLAPLALNFVAAAMHRYPYGQMVKFQLYMAPVFCMVAGIGAAVLVVGTKRRENASEELARPAMTEASQPRGQLEPTGDAALQQPRPKPPRALNALLVGLALFGIGSIVRDFWFPAKSPAVMRARDFARWFWVTAQFDGEVACLKTDLGLSFSPLDFERGLSAMYLCNQRIYSPRHARGQSVRWDQVTANWPLRCVEYHSSKNPYDAPARDQWLQRMQLRYELVGRERYPFLLGETRHRPPREWDYIEVYKFVPKPSQ